MSSRLSFDALVQKYQKPVYYFFSKRGFSRERSKELTQDTFLRAHQGWNEAGFKGSRQNWLFTIAANLWKNELRRLNAEKREGWEQSIEEMKDAGNELPNQSSLDPSQELLKGERSQQLHALVNELPEQMRRCLMLRLVQDLKYREIAMVMKISVNTVKSQIFQAKKRLEAKLGALSESQTES